MNAGVDDDYKDYYETLVLCPVCGAEIDRHWHPEKEPHCQVVSMCIGNRRIRHGEASPKCTQDRRWVHGWILVPLGKPEPRMIP